MKQYIAIDIGGTKIKHCIMLESENSAKMEKFGETDTHTELGGNYVLQTVINIIKKYAQTVNIDGICISTAGIVDPEKGEIVYSGPTFPNYKGTNYKITLENIFNIPCEVENDVNCAGLSESYIGASKNSRVSVCMTIGTGIGGSIIIDKKIFNGFLNSACEIGCMNMFDSNFQQLASVSGLIQNVARKKDISEKELNGKYILDMAKNGDKICLEEIDNMCDILGYGISNICYVVNPEVIVIGGGIMTNNQYFYNKIKSSLKKYLIDYIFDKTTISLAENGNNAGMLGAYYNFKNKMGSC